MSSGKRTACERCRDQKLRCRREDGASCVRCARAGATCVTSNAKPMGRPLRKPLYGHIDYTWMPTATPQKSPDPSRYTSRGAAISTDVQQNVFAPAASPRTGMPDSQSESTIPLQPQSWDPMMPDMQTETFSTTMDDLFSFLGPSCGSNGDDFLQGFLDEATIPNTPHIYPLTPRDSAQQSPGEEKSLTIPESAYDKDPLFALSKLNHFLIECHLLLQNQSCSPPWRISMATSKLERDSKLDKNPVGTLLRSTADFIDIVRTWTQNTTSGQARQSEKKKDKLTFYHFHPATYTLNKPTLLMMITTYILFVRMFDVLFARLITALREFPNEAAKVRFEPGFKLGGFSLPQGFLYLKIIVQAFEHQLERIESSLGLPVEYRVSISCCSSEGQCDSSGIFDNPKYQSLLKIVMMEGLEDDDVDDGGDADDGYAMRNNQGEVFRLRTKVTKIKELLQRP